MSTTSSPSFLPPWSKPHEPHLPRHISTYESSSSVSLASDGSASQHRPGRARNDGSGRMAGHADVAHPEQRQEHGKAIRQRLETMDRGEKREMIHVSKAYDRGDLDAMEQELKELFEDDKVVVSVRDIKELVNDPKLEHPNLHGKARFVLPVTEADIKGQNWAGREEEEEKKKKKKEEGVDDTKHAQNTDMNKKSDKNNNPSVQDKDTQPNSIHDQAKEEERQGRGKTDGKGDARKEEHTKDLLEGMNDKEKMFFAEIMAEAAHFDEIQNNPGKPEPVNPELEDDLEEQQVSIGVQVDDQFTPDSWVPRSSHLLRLTGKHPLNAEPELTALFEAGFQTPIKYHYVRNHAAVPLLEYESHTLTVTCLSGKSTVFSMSELETLFQPAELLVTIACDGNRRGEVNMVSKSAGFSWSAAGVSTCKWKGAFVRDVLLKAGVTGEAEDGKRLYLNYEGSDQPSEGAYATSIPLSYAMDENNDVLLAWGINGRRLAPDHGYPLRSIIPGYVGGRQVKWLKKLWITNEPNRSHYHIWDNRVVPSFIKDKNTPLGKAFFHHPDTACNEQVLQSIICKPSHEEYVALRGSPDGKLASVYRVQGFAYNGGGLAVQKVELTLDDGKTWKYCFRRLPNQPLRHGNKFWAWVHWFCDVDLQELANATELRVRAWDPAKNTQPEAITWNYMGMMNNSQYRVKFQLDSDPTTHQPALHFRHPVAPGCVDGGWMKPSPEEAIKAKAAEANNDDAKEFSLEDIEKHNTKDDAWIILDSKVYDVTSVLSWHPGGASAILAYAGKATVEASTSYSSIHDGYANSQRDKLLIGKLGKKGVEALQADAKWAAEKEKQQKEERAAFSVTPFRFVPCTLIQKKEVSKDTKLYTFALPKKKGGPGKLGLPVGKHLATAAHFKDGVVLRNYTPTRPVLASEDDGTFDLLVKTYYPTTEGPFPPGGTMGNYLDTMSIGEELDVKGPVGEIEYLGHGHFKINDKPFHFDRINLIAGGSGLTPHWQLIHAILADESDRTQISLINSNKTFDDVLLYDELERLHGREEERSAKLRGGLSDNPDHGDEEGASRLKLWYTLTGDKEGVPKDWKYGTERLDEAMMRKHLFGLQPLENVKEAVNGRPQGDNETTTDSRTAGTIKTGTFLCGPPGLIKFGASPGLKNMGFKEDETIFGF